jgi:pimeloyl-ACP methyl ester carboxylesterase
MNKYYKKVPQDLWDKFSNFRQENPPKQRQVGELTWEYILSGNSAGQPLLLLPGGLGTAESVWRMIIQLDPSRYRLICPSYPAKVDSMSALADGIMEILKQEGMLTTDVVGGAYGSMQAQVLVHRHPDLVTRLVLTHAYPPVPSRVKTVEPTLRLFRYVPMFMVKNMLRTQMTGRLPANPPPELALIAGQIRETLDTRLTRQGAINTYMRMVDFDKQNFTYTDMESWQGKALIILEEDDPTNTEDLRNTLTALYPRAILHQVKGGNHTSTLEETAEYIRIMEEFFAGKLETGVEASLTAENEESAE